MTLNSMSPMPIRAKKKGQRLSPMTKKNASQTSRLSRFGSGGGWLRLTMFPPLQRLRGLADHRGAEIAERPDRDGELLVFARIRSPGRRSFLPQRSDQRPGRQHVRLDADSVVRLV